MVQHHHPHRRANRALERREDELAERIFKERFAKMFPREGNFNEGARGSDRWTRRSLC